MSDATQKLIKDQAATIRDLKRKNFNLHTNRLWFGIVCIIIYKLAEYAVVYMMGGVCL